MKVSLNNFSVLIEISCMVNLLRGESHIDFRTQCVLMTQITWSIPPTICVITRFLTKSIVTIKCLNALDNKRYITSLNKHSCWLAFFLFHCWFQEKIDISWRNFDLNNRLEIGSKITQMHRIPLLFLVSYCSSASDFLTEDNFFFISNCRNSFNCKLKKLINE